MKIKPLLSGLLIALFVIGCSTDIENFDVSSSNSNEDTISSGEIIENVPVSSISLDRTSMSIYNDDEYAVLTATIYPENATNKNVIWTSANQSILTVTDGQINPVNVGTTTITARTEDGNKVASCSVTIKQAVTVPHYVLHGIYGKAFDVTEWTDKPMVPNPCTTDEYMILGVQLLNQDVFKIHMYGENWYGFSKLKYNSKISGCFEAGSDDNFICKSSDVYNIYCSYIGENNRHIWIERAYEDEEPSYVDVTGISIEESGKYIGYRHECQLHASISPNNADNQTIYWESSDTTIATVTSGGRVVAKEKNGVATITARSAEGNYTATCLICVDANSVPEYYLTGIIGGYNYVNNRYRYAAIPVGTGRYLIPDVNLMVGDSIKITGRYGGSLRGTNNQIYEYKPQQNMFANLYININTPSNYVTVQPRVVS